MRHSDRSSQTSALRSKQRNEICSVRFTIPLALVGVLAIIGMLGASASAGASLVVVALADPPPPTCVSCPSGYHCVHNPEGCEADTPSTKMSAAEIAPRTAPVAVQINAGPSGRASHTYSRIAQNDNYVACYKDVDFKQVRFRWCPKDKPWTATNETRTGCYTSSEACAQAEMPQSWCIKCEGQ